MRWAATCVTSVHYAHTPVLGMRPTILDPLFAPLTSLPGIGPRILKRFTALLDTPSGRAPALIDLLLHLPTGVIDRRRRPEITHAPHGEIVTLLVRIDRHQPPPPAGRSPYVIFGQDETGEVALVYFRGKAEWLEKRLPVGARRLVSGRFEWFNGRAQIVHPDCVVALEDAERLPLVEPVYPLTAEVSQPLLRNAVRGALACLPRLEEWQTADSLRRCAWPSFADALNDLHRPQTATDFPFGPARARLAYDELLANQLALALVRASFRTSGGLARVAEGRARAAIEAALPYTLTASQHQAVLEIVDDLAAPRRMLRLLQGDVGAGKTVVALLAMAQVVEAGGQAALMVPTEVLARQHLRTLAPLAEAAGFKVALLTGQMRMQGRAAARAAVAAGDVDIVIGTHALFQQDIAFRDLALAVVDEQHRFGVHQRLALAAKGSGVDILVMTATPIPRTLVMTYFGDMAVSRLTEKPAGRQPVQTVAVPLSRMEEVVNRLRAALTAGGKAYWVCPLVSESETADLAAAQARHAALQEALGPICALVHGRMSSAEKAAALHAFQSGTARVLVATTVVEVGVDVADATIMVIEHAESFGLAQLHQLRGRVGRGTAASTCLLLYRAPLGETAKARLSILRDTEDGFRIAEEDLRLRGEGEVLGTRQSGMPDFRIARAEHDGDLMTLARDEARLVLTADATLSTPRGMALRLLLYLFRRDEAIALLRAG